MGRSAQDTKHDRLALPKGRKVALSFREAADKYLHRLAEEGGADLRMKRVRLTQHLVPFFADTPLSKISGFDIERYKHERKNEKAIRGGHKQRPKDESKLQNTSAATINRELAVLSHLFTKAMEWGWIDRRPAKINRYREQNGRITYLTVEEVERLVECAKGDGNSQIYPFIIIGLETSMRRMEILSIRREHIDLNRRVIFIPKAKAGAREQPITPHLAEFLAGYPPPCQRGHCGCSHRRALGRVTQWTSESRFAASSKPPDSTPIKSSATRFDTPPSHTSFRLVSIYRPSSASAATRRWQWSSVTLTPMATTFVVRWISLTGDIAGLDRPIGGRCQ